MQLPLKNSSHTQEFLTYFTPGTERHQAVEQWINSPHYHSTRTRSSLYHRTVIYQAALIKRAEQDQEQEDQQAGPSTQTPEPAVEQTFIVHQQEVLFKTDSQYYNADTHQDEDSEEEESDQDQSQDSQEDLFGILPTQVDLAYEQSKDGQQTPTQSTPLHQSGLGLPNLGNLLNYLTGNQGTPSHTNPQPHQAPTPTGPPAAAPAPPAINPIADQAIQNLTAQVAALAGLLGQVAEQNKPPRPCASQFFMTRMVKLKTSSLL